MASAPHWPISRRNRCLENDAPSQTRGPVLSGGWLSMLVDSLGRLQQRERTLLLRGSAPGSWTRTAMSRSLLPKLLDLIVDHLVHDEPAMLKVCCIVSKLWIPRTRKHLFTHIRHFPPKHSVELWKQTFPDPSNSLARYARTMSPFEPGSATFVNPDVVGWIHSFRHIGGSVPGFRRTGRPPIFLRPIARIFFRPQIALLGTSHSPTFKNLQLLSPFFGI